MASNLVNLWLNAGGSSPDGWDFVTLDSLLLNSKSMSVGVMYPGKHFEKGVPLIKVSDVKNGEIASKPDFCISESVDNEYKRTRLKGEELLITLVGNPGDCVIVTDDMIGWNAARALAVLTLKDPSIRHWLRIVLLSSPSKHIIDSRLNTTVQKTLNLKDIRELPIPLPSKKIREQLCSIDSAFEQKCLLNRQTNQTLEQMAQALFKSWFVDFDPVFDNALASGMAVNDFPEALQKKAAQRLQVQQQIANGELEAKPLPEAASASEYWRQLFPSEFEQTDEPAIGINGWIPKGWCISNIDEEFGIKGGSTPSTKNPDFWEGGEIHWTSPKDLSGNDSKILLDTNRKITKAGLAKITSGLLPVDTVLMSSRAPVGYLAFAKVPVAINQGYIALLCKKTLSPEYTMQFLDSVMDEIKGISGGTTFAEISKKTFRSIKLIVPSKSVVDAYSSIAKAQYDKITENIKQSNTLTDTRDYLLPKLISGEIDISNNHKEI